MWNFKVNFEKIPTECYKLLKETYGDNSLSCVYVFEWYKQFSESQENTEDDQCPGQPASVSTLQAETKINKIVGRDRCLSI